MEALRGLDMWKRVLAICLRLLWMRTLHNFPDWNVQDDFDAEGATMRLLVNPDAWSDGSLVLDKVSGASLAGSGMCAHLSGSAWVIGNGVILTSCRSRFWS